jgi:hypothetical protein
VPANGHRLTSYHVELVVDVVLAIVLVGEVSLLEQHEGMVLFEDVEHVEPDSVLDDDFGQLGPANAADRTGR